jgi:hypothetical protein
MHFEYNKGGQVRACKKEQTKQKTEAYLQNVRVRIN